MTNSKLRFCRKTISSQIWIQQTTFNKWRLPTIITFTVSIHNPLFHFWFAAIVSFIHFSLLNSHCAKLVTEQKWGFITAAKSSTRIRDFAKQALAIKYNRMTFTIQHIQLRSKMSWTSLFIWLCVYFQTHLSSYSRTASLHNARKDSYVMRAYIYPPESQKISV